MKTLKFLLPAAFLAMFLFVGCNDEESLTQTNDAKVIAEIADLYNNDDVDEATDDNTKALLDRCFSVSLIPNDNGEFWPRHWVVDFGDSCVSPNGVVRSGKIDIVLTDRWINEGSLRTVTYQDFVINGRHIEGVRTIENTGKNDEGNLTWLIKLTDGKVTTDSSVVEWNMTRYSELVEGGETFVFSDNVYEHTGGGSGTKDGVGFTTEITKPLRYVFGCRWPVSGELTITTDDGTTAVIDYGDGTCDDKATLTINGETTEITLGNMTR